MSVTLPQLPPLGSTLPPLGKINLNGATIEKTRGLRKVTSGRSANKKKHNIDEENDENENSEEENEESREEDENTEENEENLNHEKDEEKSYSSENDVSPAVQSKKLDNSASFFATITDGSSFRYLIEYLRLTATEGTFIFTKDYITYQKDDEDRTIFNDVKIKTYELTDYEFSSTNSEIPVTINLADLRNKTRAVGKKEQMDIYRRPEESGNFYIQVRSQEKAGDNPVLYCMPMRSENVKLNIYQLPEYSRGKRNPNCTVHQNDFSKLCKQLVANKCSFVEFVGYERGIIIKGIASDGKTMIMVKEYGKCRNSNVSKMSTTKSIVNDKVSVKSQTPAPKLTVRDADEVQRFKIHISVIKSLAKINGFCNNGTIKFYIEPGVPMKLSIPIGTFGKMRILVRSSN